MDRSLLFVVLCGLGSAYAGVVRRDVPSTQQIDGLQGLTALATQFMTSLAAASQQNQPTQTTGIGSQFNADLTNGSIIENSFRSFFSNNGQTMNYDLSEAMQMLNQSYGIPAITNNPEALAALQMEYQNLMIDFQNKLQAKLNGEKSSRPADPVDPSTVSLSGLQQQISTLAAISPHALFVDQDERTKHLPLITRSKLVILHNGSRPDFVIRLANQLLTPSVAQMLPRNTVFKFALSLTLSNTEVTLASSSEKRLCNETRTDKWLGIQSHSKVAIPVKTKGSRHVSSPFFNTQSYAEILRSENPFQGTWKSNEISENVASALKYTNVLHYNL
ncbi:hypothetical protein MSG28_004467 [Choristoneura fumiferana]|uniref:Uncharacterized protein n=1 Tax=Choristoneura fumiferana TaxID=7141 RepID=A0ACC0K710_CHOFU|nr:hypothetical protein MSG28_004467 [Choristoneura fumiferana]